MNTEIEDHELLSTMMLASLTWSQNWTDSCVLESVARRADTLTEQFFFFVCHGIQAWQCFLMSSFICCIQSTCDGFHCINQTGSLLPLHRLPKNRWCFPFFKKSSYSKQQKPIFSCCPPDFPPKISPESRSPGVKLHLEEPAKESKRCGM